MLDKLFTIRQYSKVFESVFLSARPGECNNVSIYTRFGAYLHSKMQSPVRTISVEFLLTR